VPCGRALNSNHGRWHRGIGYGFRFNSAGSADVARRSYRFEAGHSDGSSYALMSLRPSPHFESKTGMLGGRDWGLPAWRRWLDSGRKRTGRPEQRSWSNGTRFALPNTRHTECLPPKWLKRRSARSVPHPPFHLSDLQNSSASGANSVTPFRHQAAATGSAPLRLLSAIALNLARILLCVVV
jgi:hypothetical protein